MGKLRLYWGLGREGATQEDNSCVLPFEPSFELQDLPMPLWLELPPQQLKGGTRQCRPER